MEASIGSFLMLRDLFGYLIPGAVFVGMLIASFDLITFLRVTFVDFPQWLWLSALLISSYVAGHVLVAIGYAAFSVVDALRGALPIPDSEAELQYYRYIYPSMFIDTDRRSTIHILRVGLPAALISGCWWLAVPLGAKIAFFGVGAFMLVNGYLGLAHVSSHRLSTLKAAQRAEEKGVPYFRWNGGSSKKKGKRTPS